LNFSSDAADCNDDDDDSFDSSNEKAATVADSFRELASLESSSNSCQLRTTAELDLGKSIWGGRLADVMWCASGYSGLCSL